MGVLVLRNSKIANLGARGICLFADPLPVIVFAGASPGAQAFTLAHEFGHVLLGESGIGGQPRLGGKSGQKAIEDWYNRFASAFLAPKNAVERFLEKPTSPADRIDPDKLSDLTKAFCISRHAMLIRLVGLGYVKSVFYWNPMSPVLFAEEEGY